MIKLLHETLDKLLSREWIVTNGLGGYASSTVVGANTRRYHGLLIAPLNPPTERRTFVSKVEEMIFINDHGFHLSTNEYPGTVFPEGYQNIYGFKRKPLPETHFQLGQAELIKTVFMPQGSNTTVVEYHNPSHFAYKLWLNPLYVYRDFHGTAQERHDHYYGLKIMGHTHVITPADDSAVIYFRHSHGVFTEGRTWNKNMQFRVDKVRGHEHSEDVFSLGYLEHQIEPGESIYLMFSLDHAILQLTPQQLKENELKRLENLAAPKKENRFLADLLCAGDQFLVKRKSTASTSVIAGYHWFSDWGRDSMIAVRGLCIEQGRQEDAKLILVTFLSYLRDGLIPNRFPDYEGDHVEYNTIDATLWLFVALYEYDLKFNDTQFLKHIHPKLKEIIEFQIKGTLHNIKVLENGLLSGGSKSIQITWMDAKLGDIVFTPRDGCAVEINALWYNTLKIYGHVCERINTKMDRKFSQICTKLKKTFKDAFWNENGYLNDTVNEGKVDTAVRPNQIYAVSLPFSLLGKKEEKQVVQKVKDELVTPYGLRTLDQKDPQFRAKYEGDLMNRDSAYHQGTVWPFLLPEYCLAYLKVNHHSESARKEMIELLQPLKKHFYNDECIHGISEIFDGLKPAEGKGCIHQAWSVSNLILLMMKEGLDV